MAITDIFDKATNWVCGHTRQLTAMGVMTASALYAPTARAGDGPKASIVIETKSGRVLHAENPDELRHPASTAKLMTLYLTFEAIHSNKLTMEQPLTVSAAAEAAGEGGAFDIKLKKDQTISVRDAILAEIVHSGCDAAVVLAEAVGGSEKNFASMMTAKAKKIGMSENTVFRNASGLPDPKQKTTARSMAILMSRLIADFPEEYKLFQTPSAVINGHSYANHVNLMTKEHYEGMDGGKTGYVDASGHNLVASAERCDEAKHCVRLVGVVFGESKVNRDTKMRTILDKGFANVSMLPDTPVVARIGDATPAVTPKAVAPVVVVTAPAPASHEPIIIKPGKVVREADIGAPVLTRIGDAQCVENPGKYPRIYIDAKGELAIGCGKDRNAKPEDQIEAGNPADIGLVKCATSGDVPKRAFVGGHLSIICGAPDKLRTNLKAAAPAP
ncbi:MAG: D-alanyl-D-alanine carboxypeptidase family protein [Alphaproteobacteria bacterium]